MAIRLLMEFFQIRVGPAKSRHCPFTVSIAYFNITSTAFSFDLFD